MRPMKWKLVASFTAIAAVAIFFVLRTNRTDPAVITGEIVETYCWAKMAIGGIEHAACGIECAKRGIPIAIVDARSRDAYVLLPGRDKRSVPSDLIAAMGRTVSIRGEIQRRGGTNFLSVQSWTMSR